MMARHKRLWMVVGILAGVSVAAWLGTQAFRSNVMFFFDPTQIAGGEAPVDKRFRLGGMVEKGSVKRQADGVTVQFIVTDTAKSIPVTFRGSLPDLFREGKGVVAQGQLGADGVFRANEVLAKHDENYMPPEAKAAVEKAHETARTLKQ